MLTDALSWRWILFANLPIAALACFVTWRSVPESSGAGAEEGIDVPGVATLSVGLVALLLALDQVTDWGWSDPRILGLFAACVLLLVAFAVIERRAGARALIPRDVMANPAFRAACLATLLMSATFFAVLLYLPQFMQKILGWTPLQAGAGLLPMMGVFAVISFAAGPLYERFGAKIVVSAGAACLTLGIFLISLVDARLGLGRAGARHGRDRPRRRTVLLVDHDGGGHGARPVALEPRRRHRLHVPGGRRVGRARA